MYLSEIWIYPLKSAGGIKVKTAKLVETGLELDRYWTLVDESGNFLSQRQLPELALFKTRVLGNDVYVTRGNDTPVVLPRFNEEMSTAIIHLWKDEVLAGDCGDELAAWFSSRLGKTVRLMVMTPRSLRKAEKEYDSAHSRISFSDGYPLLLIGTGSLHDLNSRLVEKVEMSRFRPNLVIACDVPYAEDGWSRIQFGEVLLDVVKPCARCAITTVDQATARRGEEPLKTLSRYRKWDGKVWFGQNAVHRTLGRVQVGMPVTVLENKN